MPAHGVEGMPSFLTFFMQVTFNTSGSVILMPWTFATLGYVLGPLLMVMVFGITLSAQYFVNEATVAQAPNSVKTLKDLACCIGGRHLGKLAAIIQFTNLLLVMPAELDVTSSALQYVVNATPGSSADCNIIYILIVAIPSFLVTQVVRSFGHKTCVLACLSFMVILTKSSLIIYSVFQHADSYAADASPVISSGSTWSDTISACGNFLWIFAPVFINTELVTEMRYPQHVHKQLLAAACCLIALYTVVGVTGAVTWGSSVQEEINLQMPYDWAGITVNCLLIYGAWLDYLIAEIVCTGYLQEFFEPTFDKQDFSPLACARWFTYTLPSNVTALLLISFVPQFETLVGIVTATTIASGSFILPALVGLHFQPKHGELDEVEAGRDSTTVPDSKDHLFPTLKVSNRRELVQWLVAAFGVFAMTALLSAAVDAIAEQDYTVSSAADLFCNIAR